jgi:hypothetical protein
MAKRGRRKRTGGNDVLIDLARQLTEVERRRQDLLRQIVSAAGQELASSPATGAAPSAGTGGQRRGGRRKGFKMSAEARAKIAAAQRKRWAKQKAEKKT